MIGVTEVMKRRGNVENSEEFTVAKRSLGTGLTAAGVTSSWTWSTTLLSSVTVAYEYGVAGSFFYAACNSTQIMIFSNLAIQCKRKAPNARTFLEIIRVRYGTIAHFSFMFFSLASNILVVSSILIGGAAAINSLTGMSVYASLWLLPLSVSAYTMRGGLRATILTDYIHTAIILIIILIFWFKVYASGTQIGSPGKMWDLLIEAAKRNNYSAPTKDGSYLSIRSLGALKFAILSILEYTGVVFLDNSFHQKGIAADPASAIPGYVLGGLAWYAMPFTLATTMGILAVALENTPAFPTYPRRMNTQEIGAGLALPFAAQTIAGKGGAGAVLVLMFMSCTSAISSVMIGVSTVLSYDVYKTYINPKATDSQVLRAGHWCVAGFAIFMAAFATMLHGINIDLGFIYNMTGIFTGSALPALVGTFFSSRQGAVAATASIWTGFFAAVITWLNLAQRFSGEVSIASVGATDPCLYGCIAGIGAAAVVTIVVSIFENTNYSWESLAAIRLVDDEGNDRDVAYADPTYDPERLRKAAYVARAITLFLFLALFIIWPLTLYGTAYQFSKKFFTGWVIVSLLWAFFSFFSVTIFPIIEGRHLLWSWARDLFGGKRASEKHGDEFDHHRHVQQYDESDIGVKEKEVGVSKTAAFGLKEESDS
ncbi:putative DUR3-urea permease [Mollisia scopiformis]|uniref:Putative DUR3-urea permease n=1 Tax=Mollisia scopiformis TaxID=149040 RepID=A0A132B7E6_MOLSC|nr:putative DUR3-urea permease [Mollisia scopiformis]KUJ08332.1 putative DUR3-urea permease [Mollisia scopiformis]